MGKQVITGGSDDIISLNGDVSDEIDDFCCKGRYLAWNDGTVVKVWYDADGIWRTSVYASGQAGYLHIEGDVEADTFDVLTLEWDQKFELLQHTDKESKIMDINDATMTTAAKVVDALIGEMELDMEELDRAREIVADVLRAVK